jgi:hypothetical protein
LHGLAITQQPGWRLFMTAWTGLEVLARRAGRDALPRHGARTDLPAPLARALSHSDAANPPLLADFTALALDLALEDAERDVSRFQQLKAVRDSLLHGDPLLDDQLPAQDARALLGEYVERATTKYIES